jgi:class 3 adenylate cyclase/DNA-binding SARP family transcriptional activator
LAIPTLKAVLFADAAQYSRHVLAHERATLDFMDRCFSSFRELAHEYGGHVVKTTGDGALVEFSSAVAAVRYGLAAQAYFKGLTDALPADQQIRFRMGVHLGDVQERGGDLYGHIINVAARIEGLAEPGGICVSQAVYEQVHTAVPAVYKSLGPRVLKNIGEPVVAYQIRRAAEAAENEAHGYWTKLSISVLERLAVADPTGNDLTPKSAKARALIGYLALNEHFKEVRERVAGLLWSDQASEKAGSSLKALIKQVRMVFERAGSNAFRPSVDDVGLMPSAVEVDLLRLSHNLTEGTVAPELIEGRIAPEHIMAGLDGIDRAFAAWLRVARQRWRDRLADQLEDSLDRFNNDALASKHAALALLNLDPTHEKACRVLMQRYAADGKVPAALRVFQTLREVLARDFEIEPSPETIEIVRIIRSERPPAIEAAPQGVRREPKKIEERLPVIEVSPFLGRSAPSRDDHLFEGFRREIVACLIRFRDWVIIEGQSSPAATEATAKIDYRLEAHASAAPGETSIAITLVDATTNRFVWSDRFSIALQEWPSIHANIARRIAACLDIYLSAERVSGRATRADVSLEAYDMWLRGENLLTRWHPEAEAEAEQLFNGVIARMPRFAPAYASLASIYNVRHLVIAGFFRKPELEARALKLAQQAVELDPLDTRAHLTLAWSYTMAGRYEQADIHYDLAFDLNPNNPKTLISCAHGLAYTGRVGRASEFARLALSLTPVVAPYQWGYLAGIRFICGDYGGCITAAGMATGSLLDIGIWRAAGLAHLGRIDDARRSGEEFLASAREQWGAAVPDDATIVAWVVHGFPIKEPDRRKRLVEGLRLAGLPAVEGQ